jgi:hypothetical protein
MARKHRFKVVEHVSGYAVYDTVTTRSHWMSDGVDAVFTRSGKAMRPGSEHFRKEWERSLNQNESETAEAYGFDDKEDE